MLNLEQVSKQELLDNMNIRMIDSLGYYGISTAFRTGYGENFDANVKNKKATEKVEEQVDTEESLGPQNFAD